jgi:protein-S-isoprenylcysteine O-methyltransferase Ste14
MKAQLDTRNSTRRLTLLVSVAAVLCSFAAAAGTAQAQPGPGEYAASAVAHTGTYANVRRPQYVFRTRIVRGVEYAPKHFVDG